MNCSILKFRCLRFSLHNKFIILSKNKFHLPPSRLLYQRSDVKFSSLPNINTAEPHCGSKLLFSCPDSKYYVYYNIFGGAACALFTYLSYLYYNERISLKHVNKSEGKNAFSSIIDDYDYSMMRIPLSVTLFVSGFLIAAGMLRFTLRSIRSLVLLKDKSTLQMTTCTITGKDKTRILPVSDIYAHSINDTLEGYDHSAVQVRGELLQYVLDVQGVTDCPNNLKEILCTRKPFVED